MEQLRVLEEQRHEEVKLYKLILDFMSCEKVVITGMSRLSLCCWLIFQFASLCSAQLLNVSMARRD